MNNYNNYDKQTELVNCNFIKTVLMVMVVLYHSIAFWNGGIMSGAVIPSSPLKYLTLWLCNFHIYGFTFVSGYIFYHLKIEKDRYKKYSSFVINKTKRLIVPYFFVCIVWTVPIAIYYFHYTLSEVLNRYLLATAPNQLWFLWMLFGVFLLFNALSDFMRKRNLLGGAISLAFYLLSFFARKYIPNYFQIWNVFEYFFFFWLGFKLRQYGSKFIRKIPITVWLIADMLLFVLLYFVRTGDSIFYKIANYGFMFLRRIVDVFTAFVVLQRIADAVKWQSSKIFTFFSKNSMPIYLFHQQVIYFTLTQLNGLINPHLHAVINFAASLGMSLAIGAFLLKFKPTRFLLGEKQIIGGKYVQ